MPARKRPVIYLAGPMSGCNAQQMREWRERVKHDFGNEFEFIDPTEEPFFVADAANAYEIVRHHEDAIARSDGVLANLWKESVGTALAIAKAHAQGIPVVVANPNHIEFRLLSHYATAVESRVSPAMRSLRGILRARSNLLVVVKADGGEEPFSPDKLVRSVRLATTEAARNEALVPAVVVPRVLTVLTAAKPPAKGKVTTRAIRDAVWQVLRDLEADALRAQDFSGVREAWERYDEKRRPRPRIAVPMPVIVHARPQRVRVSGSKSHATIWGKAIKDIADIPMPARFLFQEICRVDGIAEIHLTLMSAGPAVPGVRAEILASKTAAIIEGKCYAEGPKGEVQMFQIRVHDAARTEPIRERLVTHLAERRLLKLEG